MMKEHLGRVVRTKGEHRGIPEMRKHIGWYSKGLAGAAAFRREINTLYTQEQVLQLIDRWAAGLGGTNE